MWTNKALFAELTKISKMTISSPGLRGAVVNLTYPAFYNPKPLFTNEQKPVAAKLIEKSLPVINEGFVYFSIGMILDRRQPAQISRSGLQYLIDEFKDDQKIYQKLKPIFDDPGVKGIEEDIEAYTGIPPDYTDEIEIDLTKIPSSHFWWLFIDEDDEE